MTEEIIRSQAIKLEDMIPKLANRLFELDMEHPAAEMPLAQLRVCIMLQHGPAPLSMIADELRISNSAATQIADRLEKSGLVERLPEAGDRRIKKLALTKSGMEVMSSRLEARLDRISNVLSRISTDNRELIIKAFMILLSEASMSVGDD